MTDQELLTIAKNMQELAYAPYSGYRVGAALLCADNTVFTGCNVENISYGATICAERTALVKAISEGKRDFVRMAISVSGDEIGMPCGICRQVIGEFVSPDFMMICANNKDEMKTYPFSYLMPSAFCAESIRKETHDNGRS